VHLARASLKGNDQAPGLRTQTIMTDITITLADAEQALLLVNEGNDHPAWSTVAAKIRTANWVPDFSAWRHGGWYVHNIRYPSGAVGCVSRNYPDRKWRIACDHRPGSFYGGPDDHTYASRIAAARAEREVAEMQWQRIAQLEELRDEGNDYGVLEATELAALTGKPVALPVNDRVPALGDH